MKQLKLAMVLVFMFSALVFAKQVKINMDMGTDGMQMSVQEQQSNKKHGTKKSAPAPEKITATLGENGIELSDGRVIPVSYTKALFPYPKVEILEPVGAKITLYAPDEEGYTDEAPLLWKDAPINAYIKMVVVEDGKTWSVKFQARQQQDVTIGSKDAAPAQKKAHHGRLVNSKHFTMAKQVYSENEGFSVKFHDMPGSNTDWINVVPAGSDNTEWGTWQYTNGAAEGFFSVPGQAKGKYELRAYYDNPSGGYVIHDVMTFIIE